MATTLKVTVRYDGTDFAGWQVQPRRRTVQGEIEQALSRIVSEPVRIMGAGRTDAGVHALAQVCSCTWPGPLNVARLQRSLCAMLAPAIRIERIEPAPPGFNALADATGKHYAYSFCVARTPDPLSARYAWTVPWDLDWDAVAGLAQRLVGEHDFAGFACRGADVKTTVRTIHSITLEAGATVAPGDSPAHRRLVFHGNGFLYKMVRNITGTLIYIARGTLPESRLDEMLASPGPYRGYTAPAHGLTLVRVEY